MASNDDDSIYQASMGFPVPPRKQLRVPNQPANPEQVNPNPGKPASTGPDISARPVQDAGSLSGFAISGFGQDTPPSPPRNLSPELQSWVNDPLGKQSKQAASSQPSNNYGGLLEDFGRADDLLEAPEMQSPPPITPRKVEARVAEPAHFTPAPAPQAPPPPARPRPTPTPPPPPPPVEDERYVTRVPGQRSRKPESLSLDQGIGMYICGPQSDADSWKLCAFHALSDGETWKSGKHAFEITRNADGHHLLKAISDLDGVFEKLSPDQPYPIVDGTRFRFGNYVVEFQYQRGAESETDLEGDSANAAFSGRLLGSSAALAFLGPDGRPCLTIPLISREQTILGRGGSKGDLSCDLTLPDEDVLLSRAHLKIIQDGNRATLMDLGSTNGTFIWRQGATPIVVGTSKNEERATQILSGDFLVRFVGN